MADPPPPAAAEAKPPAESGGATNTSEGANAAGADSNTGATASTAASTSTAAPRHPLDYAALRSALLSCSSPPSDPSKSQYSAAHDAAQIIRDNVSEIVHDPQQYALFLQQFLPAFGVVLSTGTRPTPPPSAAAVAAATAAAAASSSGAAAGAGGAASGGEGANVTASAYRAATLAADADQAALRTLLLETLTKCPRNAILRPYATQYLSLMMDVLVKDYEENALMAVRMVFDLHKNFRGGASSSGGGGSSGSAAGGGNGGPDMERGVQPFLDYVAMAYRHLGAAVIQNFGACRVERYLDGPAAAEVAAELQQLQQKEASAEAAAAGGSSSGAGADTKEEEEETPMSPSLTGLASPLKQTSATATSASASTPADATTTTSSSSPHHASSKSPSSSSKSPSSQALAIFQPTPIRSTSSFKVLTECPLAVMLLFQLYPKCMKGNIHTLIPLMIDCLGVRIPSVEEYAYNFSGSSGSGGSSGGGSGGSQRAASGTTKAAGAAGSDDKRGAAAESAGAGTSTAAKVDGEATTASSDKAEGGDAPTDAPAAKSTEEGTDAAGPAATVQDVEMKDAAGSKEESKDVEMQEKDSGAASAPPAPAPAPAPASAAAPTPAPTPPKPKLPPQVIAAIQSLSSRHHAQLSRHLIAAQVKTLSFLTYLLRGYSNEMAPYSDRIASSVIYLFKICPRDALSTRKELLVATRHILGTEFRIGFVRRIDFLLDDKVMIGTSRPSSNEVLALRPLAYSTLADLIHHVRSKLSMVQINRVVTVFGRVVHDDFGGHVVAPSAVVARPGGSDEEKSKDDMEVDSELMTTFPSPTRGAVASAIPTPPLPLPVHITSIRLLLNLVDHIFQNRERDAQMGRNILYRILEILVRKLENVKEWGVSGILILESKNQQDDGKGDEHRARKHSYLRSLEEANSSLENSSSSFHYPPPSREQLHSIQSLVRPIVVGIKTVIWCMNSYGAQRERQRRELARRAAASEEAVAETSKKSKKKKTKASESAKEAASADAKKLAAMGEEDHPLAIQKLCPSERDLIDRYLVAAVGCLEVFRVKSPPAISKTKTPGETLFQSVEKARGPSESDSDSDSYEALVDFGRWPVRDELIRVAHYRYNVEGIRVDDDHNDLVMSPVNPAVPATLASSATVFPAYQTIIELYAASFSILDSFNLRRVLGPRLPLFFDAMVADPLNFQGFFRHLLLGSSGSGGGTSSYDFCDVLLDFLVTKLKDIDADVAVPKIGTVPQTNSVADEEFYCLSTSDQEASGASSLSKRTAACIIRLFEMCLSSMTNSARNEENLRPRLQMIVTICLGNAMRSGGLIFQDSPNDKLDGTKSFSPAYLHLLRSLFRTVAGGKFEESYKELLPLLPSILNGLWRIYSSIVPSHTTTSTDIIVPGDSFHRGSASRDELNDLRNIIIDLCLTVPARLSSLLPHLPLLVRVIIPALRSESADLVNLGLRTLEFWVDNLNPDFLYPILSAQNEILAELMQGLTYHLRPAPYPYGLLTLRLLGKLGGKNRLWLGESIPALADALKEGNSVPRLSIEGAWDCALDHGEGDKMEVDGDDSCDRFAMPLPIERATTILRAVACAPQAAPDNANDKSNDHGTCFRNSEGFLSTSFFNSKDDIGGLHLPSYCADALEATKQEQASSALTVLRSALSVTVDLPATSSSIADGIEIKYTSKGGVDDDMDEDDDDPTQEGSPAKCPGITRPAAQSGALTHIIRGLFYATQIAYLRDEAKDLLIGLAIHMLLICESHRDCIVPVDGDGRRTESFYELRSDDDEKVQEEGNDKRRIHVANGKIHSLPPFGNFRFEGVLKDKVSCFLVNDVIVAMLCEGGGVKDAAIELIRELVDFSRLISEKKASDSKPDKDEGPTEPSGSLFFESLLSSLLGNLFASSWPYRSGIYRGIVELIRSLSSEPSDQDNSKDTASSAATAGVDFVALYEFELVHASLFCLKDCPRESPLAAKEALQFYFELWSILYGPILGRKGRKSTNEAAGIRDCVLVECEPDDINDLGAFVPTESDNSGNTVSHGIEKKEKREQVSDADKDGDEPKGADEKLSSAILPNPSPVIWELLLMEMCSTKQLLRFAIRHTLQNRLAEEKVRGFFSTHVTAVKRTLFSRSLRILPLPDQVGIVEGLAFLITCFPDVLPLTDQHLLAFLSELLKMLSIADDIIGDTSNVSIGVAVDRNGCVCKTSLANTELGKVALEQPSPRTPVHGSKVFLRKEMAVQCSLEPSSPDIIVPPELPMGVQLRATALALFRAVVVNHPATFFNAEKNSPAGNIRPHVISLFFRSLVATPPHCVATSYAALRDVLSLSEQKRDLSSGGVSPTKVEKKDVDEAGKDGEKEDTGEEMDIEGGQASQPSTKYQLPKELLQTCIRPILLDLRDHTKVNIALLRALSRLLSLLSAWFNQTLGDKLLDHLTRFTSPDKIIESKVFKEGEEPLLAANIIGLFSLLNQNSVDFVEQLVKSTIRLETVLPHYRYTNCFSPFRTPLARYLSKNCKNTFAFFVNHNRMKNPLYSDMFRDIIQRKESAALRAYLSSRECSAPVLTVCFERPLEIIRKEENAAPGSPQKPMNTAELLKLHGIRYDGKAMPKPPEIDKREMALRKEVEMKMKKVELLKVDEERSRSRLAAAATNADPPITEIAKAALQQQHQAALKAREKAQMELVDAKKEYTAILAQNASKSSTGSADGASGQSSTGAERSMTLEALELQHQGFKIIQILIDNDPNYLREHNSVMQTMRWLWRSKGRLLRFKYSETIPPKYHEESYMLASFLVSYSQAYPNDVDILFDLLRVLMQPSTFDFTFVKDHLQRRVSAEMTLDQMKNILSRFFVILNGDEADDIKILTLQILVLPLLQRLLLPHHHPSASFSPSSEGGTFGCSHDGIGHPALEGSVEALATASSGDHKSTTGEKDGTKGSPILPPMAREVIDDHILSRFLNEAILPAGMRRRYGSRLTAELLKMSSLLLEFFWQDLEDSRKELIKNSWSLIKCEDINTKNWAYQATCRFISVYEAPPRIIHQVYIALLRAYQPESKDLVRLSLDLLIPTLLRRLDAEDFRRAIKYTNKVMHEEGGHSIPQLTHIFQTIVRNPEVFYYHRHLFVPQMVNALTRIGLPASSPHEHRELSITLVELVLDWEDGMPVKGDSKAGSMLRAVFGKNEDVDAKTGTAGDETTSASIKSKSEDAFSLDKHLVSTVANFLLRMILHAAESSDKRMTDIGSKASSLFDRIIRARSEVDIQKVHLEKVASLCSESLASMEDSSPDPDDMDGNNDEDTASSPRKRGQSKDDRSGSKKSLKTIALPFLIASVDIFVTLLRHGRYDVLFGDSEMVRTILASCFQQSYGNSKGKEKLQASLKSFICLSRQHLSQDLIQNIRCYMERVLMEGGKMFDVTEKNESSSSAQVSSSSPSKDHCSAHFILESLEELSKDDPSILEIFTKSIIFLADKLLKDHAAEATMNNKHMTTVKTVGGSGYQSALSSPVAGIFEEATAVSRIDSLSKMQEPAPALLSLVLCIKLVSTSTVPYTFNDSRRVFFDILTTILEQSDSVYVLVSTAKVIGKWLLQQDSLAGGPLTLKERKGLMARLIELDYRGLPEVAMQPVVDLVASIALAQHGWTRDMLEQDQLKVDRRTGLLAHSDLDLMDEESLAECSGAKISGNELLPCLLTGNSKLRRVLVCLFCSKIPSKKIFEVLFQLLSSNYQGVGEKMWSIVFVDLLLACASHDGAVRSADKSLQLEGSVFGHALVRDDGDGSDGTDEPSDHWLPSPALVPPSAPPSTTKGKGKGRPAKKKPPPSKKAASAKPDPLVQKYSSFLTIIEAMRSPKTSSRGLCISAIRNIAQCDVLFCQELFQVLIPAAWARMPNNQWRSAFVPPLESLLSQSHHSQFLKHSHGFIISNNAACVGVVGGDDGCRPLCRNVVQSFLQVLSKLDPGPQISSDLLMHLANEYNCWHEVLSLLENQYCIAKSSGAPSSYQQDLVSLMNTCYLNLKEDDIVLASKLGDGSFSAGTTRALSRDVYGMVEKALDDYSDLIEKASSICEDPSTFAEANGASCSSFSDSEVSLWEERWVELNREMSQWGVLSDYAEESGAVELEIECGWKSGNWDKVRNLCTKPEVAASLELGDHRAKMNEVFLAIVDGKLNEVENIHAQTAQLCLQKWQLLPSVSSGGNSHRQLLESFHRLVELRESGQIMVETSHHSSNQTTPDLKNLLKAWRHRLPNEHDPITTWDEIFIWRNHMFSAIHTNFSWLDPESLATLHDKPWTAIRATEIARKQNRKEMAQISLNNLTECAMDVTDAFTKLREQILVYENGNEMEKSGGMNLINTTNLSFFNSSQKSELFRLKGKFSTHLGGRSRANQMFCRAIQVCPSYSNAWASWGELCSSIGYELEEKAKTEATDEKTKEASIATGKKSCQYLAQGMGCYLEAVHWNAKELDGLILPKVLWMLSKEESPDGVLCHTFDARTIGLPSWIWLPWLSQLLTCLCRVEGESVKDILSDIVTSHPQSVYFMLRAFYLERRDTERIRDSSSSGATGSSSQQQRPQSPSVRHAEELMSTLRRAHPTLWSSLEVVLEELIVRFRPSLEEELLATIAALKERVESQLEQEMLNGGEEVPNAVASFQKTLNRVSIKFFQSHSSNTESSSKDERSKKAAQFRRRYKSAFERDFHTTAPSKGSEGDKKTEETKKADEGHEEPLSLSELHKQLKKWNQTLDRQISMAPSSFPLQQASPQLSFFSSDSPDLWPGTCDANYPGPKPSRRTGDNDDASLTSSTSTEAGQAESIAGNAAQLVAAAAAREGMAGHAGGGTAAVEIPGQYAPYRATALDSKPRPELHTKLTRFHPVVETLRRKNQVNRRLGLIGNDGRTHKFLLQFAIPYWTRSDERAAQLNYACSALMKSNPMAARKNLTMQPTAVTAIAQRLRMTADDTSNQSLEGIYADYCDQIGRDREDASNQSFEEVIRLLGEAKEAKEVAASDRNKEETDLLTVEEIEKKQAAKKALERNVRLKAFEKVCQEHVESDVLLRSTRTYLGTPERSYHFRQSFARSVALNSLMQYVFAVVDRSPERFVFNMRTGQIVSTDFRLGYSNQGFLEPATLPFRMSRNIQELLGPLLLQGLFVPSMGIAAAALHARNDVLSSLLCLLLRDDIVHWYVSKSNARSDSKTRDLERQLMDRVQKNTTLAERRLEECVPNTDDEPDNGEGKDGAAKGQKSGLMDEHVRELLKTAMDPEKLSMMQNSYQSWL